MKELKYKSFCWSFGTTSFRTKNFNKTIEQQLILLKEFWELEGHDELSWTDGVQVQEKYYEFLHKKGFLVGNASRKDKDAREKTSGLVDIGLINEERLLTNAGNVLLEIVNKKNIGQNDFLLIPNDSLIYLKQLLKYGVGIDGNYIRPLVAIIYAICKLEYLTFDEFTYLLPLATDRDSLLFIIDSIKDFRKSKISIDEIIIKQLMSMDNYKYALEVFMNNKISKDLIYNVGLNRKSRKYDNVYYNLYKSLYDKYILCKKNVDKKIINAIKENTNNSISNMWMNLLFDTYNVKSINEKTKHTKKTRFDNVKNENMFKKVFFEYMHLIKAKATLSDYYDLNMRYLRTTNCITFNNKQVKLDIIPSIVFNNIKDELLNIVDKKSTDLFVDVSLNKICKNIDIKDKEFINLAEKKLGKKYNKKQDLINLAEASKYQKLNDLIDELFTKENLIKILTWFEERNDKDIQKLLDCEADIPTIFEYIIGIAWYIISDKKGKILDYMKLSLDADLLPRSHAVGGMSDIIYEYEKTTHYPKHVMLIEATLSEKTGQRKMEMEPVSRHLGDYLLYNKAEAYCTFVTNYLNPNLISDFRARKNMIYYDRSDSDNSLNGMKIIPIETKMLKIMLKMNYNYDKIYRIFEKAHLVDEEPLKWYKHNIEDVIVNSNYEKENSHF